MELKHGLIGERRIINDAGHLKQIAIEDIHESESDISIQSYDNCILKIL